MKGLIRLVVEGEALHMIIEVAVLIFVRVDKAQARAFVVIGFFDSYLILVLNAPRVIYVILFW